MVENTIIKFGAATSLIVSLLSARNCMADNAPTPAPRDSKPSVRLASFAPSCTELIESLHGQDCLVGVCKFCDLPSPTNQTTQSKIERVGDFNSVNLERLTRLKPDLVLTVTGQESLIGSLKKSGFSVKVFSNSKLADISHNLIEVGKLTNHEREAVMQARAFDKSIKELESICNTNVKSKPNVFFCVWPQPLLTAGKNSFLNEAVTVCGGRNIAGDLAAPYPHYSLERLVLTDPEVVIMPYEAKTNDYLHRAPWTSLKAAKQQQIHFLPKNESDRLNRPSIQVIEGLEWLGESLHPEKSEELSKWLLRTKKSIESISAEATESGKRISSAK